MHLTIATINALNGIASLDERVPILATEIERIQPDILCLQETLHVPGFNGQLEPRIGLVFDNANLSLAVLSRSMENFLPILSSTAIAYRPETLDLIENGTIKFGDTPYFRFPTPDVAYAVLRTRCPESPRDIIVFSAHLAWGGENGGERLSAVKRIEGFAAHLAARYPDAPVFLAGDFNETPTGAAIRYLTGNSEAVPGAFWIDAWRWLKGDEPGITQFPTSKYAAATALRNGIENPATLPERRLDYIMVRSWAYGKLGANPQIDLWGSTADGDVSDHLGLALRFDL